MKFSVCIFLLLSFFQGFAIAEGSSEKIGKSEPPFDFENNSPLEFLVFLQGLATHNPNGFSSLTIWTSPSPSWIREEDIPKLLERLNSEEPCANVCMSISSYRGSVSTCGREAEHLINGFRNGHYPLYLCSLTPQSKKVDPDGIRQWYADRQNKSANGISD